MFQSPVETSKEAAEKALFQAAENGDLANVEKCVANGANVESLDGSYQLSVIRHLF